MEDDGTIIAWYLPGLLSNVNQVNWRLSTHKLEFMTSLGMNLEQFAILETNFAVQPVTFGLGRDERRLKTRLGF